MHSQRYISLLCMDSHKTQSPISLEICGLNGNVSERIEITGYHLHMYETKQNEKNIFFFFWNAEHRIPRDGVIKSHLLCRTMSK